MKTERSSRLAKGPTRRSFLEFAGAGAGAAALSVFPAPAIRAAENTVKIGFISPQTGPLAAFGAADDFVLQGVRKAIAGGLEIGGTTYSVEILARDSQSNPNRVAEVASELILRDEVNIMVASSTADTVNPAADQCEINEIPCVTTDTPWDAYYFARGGKPDRGFDWTYHFFWGLQDLLQVFTDMWSTADTNKSVGALFANDVEGNTLADENLGFPKPIRNKGYKITIPGLMSPGAEDLTSFISRFKSADCQILTGAVTPPDFAAFWAQAAQQRLRQNLQFATVAKAMLFPAAVEALGEGGLDITTEVWWSPSHPFKSGLTGQSAAGFAKQYTAETGRQWTQPLGFKHAVLEVAVDCLKRSGDPADREAVRQAIIETNYESLVGPVSWNFGDHRNPVKNVCTTPLVGGQWKKGQDFPFDLQVVNNVRALEIPITGTLTLLNR
ncbi:ABC transporter substrate-binding protein [Chelativorans alearense]|uniref:ABC transporter substrate-binding protein n=1 Tax=Chelativorans alearense TaxID=2681495 RepID=UPI0013D3C29C|nr:ABC transporter substrate-binding protein [Chelativorans alearense]